MKPQTAFVLRVALVAAFSLAAQSAVHAQAPPTAPPVMPPVSNTPVPQAQPGTIEGSVVKASDGQPLKRARVTLRPQVDGRVVGRPRTYVANSDASGKFTLSNIQPGRYRLSVERQGYVRAEYGQRQPGRPGAVLAIDPGQRMRDLLFRLLDDGVITGRVTDEDGEPVIGGFVQTMRLIYSRGQKQFAPQGGAQTNDKGEYRIFGLSPGKYYLSASARSLGIPGGPRDMPIVDEGQGFDEVYAPSYYPGTTDPQNATALQVGPGDEITGIDLSVSPARAFRVRGRITAPPQVDMGQTQRRGGLQAMLMRRASGGVFSRAFSTQANVDQEQGTFEFRAVLPGSYVVMAMAHDGRRMITHREPVEVGRSDVEGLNVVMRAGEDISGKVRIEGAAGVNVRTIRVMFVPNEEMFTGASTAQVGEDSTFIVPGVTPGEKHYLSVQGLPPNFFIKSARIGGEDVLEAGLMSVGKGSGLEIVLSANGGRIEGTVLDADSLPAAAATVVLVPAVKLRNNPSFYRVATTDALGKFSMQGISPGEYKLFSWDDADTGSWQDPEFLAPFEERGARVSIAEGAAVISEVRLIVNK